LSYLSFNETGVPTFTIPYYMNGQPFPPPYPRELDIRYPKVGETNPTVAFNLLDLASFDKSAVPVDAFSPEELIIGEVAWVTDGHDAAIFHAFNRVQDLVRMANETIKGQRY